MASSGGASSPRPPPGVPATVWGEAGAPRSCCGRALRIAGGADRSPRSAESWNQAEARRVKVQKPVRVTLLPLPDAWPEAPLSSPASTTTLTSALASRNGHPSADPASDEALVVAAASGDMAAFEALVVRHGGTVLAALERLGLDRHAAEDAAQEAWVKLHAALPRYRVGAAFRPWLYSIVVNQGRDAQRRAQHRPRGDELALALVHAPRWSAPDEATLERGAIEHALAAVDASFREALVLVDVLGFDYEAAAEALGCAIGTIKSRVHRGRDTFRAAYERAAHPADRRSDDAAPETTQRANHASTRRSATRRRE
jgi:RNA polymerase sigma-70 factor (ECF subfamily)